MRKFTFVFVIKALNLHEKQMQKLEQYITQINNDTTLRHKIETINLMLTKSTVSPNSSSQQVDNDNDNDEMLNINSKIQENGAHKSETIDYNQIELLLIDLKKYIGLTVNYWNNKMSDFLKKSKYEDVSN